MRVNTPMVGSLMVIVALALAGGVMPVSSGQACTVKIGVATDFTGGAALVGEG